MLKKIPVAIAMILACAATTTPALAQDEPTVKILPQPPMVMKPPMLEGRRQVQLLTAGSFEVFNNFSFSDRQPESGITFRHRSVEDTAKTYKAVHYDHGNGIAAADVDGDGLTDVLFVNQVGANELWRNRGDGTFEDISELAGIGMADRISVGASFADIDNDGDPDLFISSVRTGNRLFENQGAGRFTDITATSGTGHQGHSSGAVFFDFDRDGLLDLFVTNVGQYTSELLRKAENDGVEYSFYDGYSDAFSGHLFEDRTEQSILYRNLGGNRFEDVSQATGLVDTGWSGDATAADINGDGWTDLYTLNMQGHDHYYENQQGKGFVRKSRDVFPKTSWGAMGIKAFDWNNDGRSDLFITDMHSDMSQPIGMENEKHKSHITWSEDHLRSGGQSIFGNSFFEQQADGSYTEISDAAGTENYWPWGLSAADFNADGFQDVFLTSSMNYPFRYGVNSLLLNENGKRFRDAEFILGVEPRRQGKTATPWFRMDCDGVDRAFKGCKDRSGLIEVWGAMGTRSSVIFDLDRDGDLDIITNEFNSVPMVLVSNLSQKQAGLKYLEISLKGKSSNRSGIGARVQVTTNTGTFTQVQDGKSGYLSQSDFPLYFGLGDSSHVDRITVQWPSGKTQTVDGPVALNDVVRIEEP